MLEFFNNDSKSKKEELKELKMTSKSEYYNYEEQAKLLPVILYVSSIPLNYENGSKDSIDFINSILKCPNKEIFRTKYIQSLLKSKWNSLKRYHYIQAFIYLIYISILSVYLIALYDNPYGLIMLLSVGFILSLYDFFQIYKNWVLFLADIWNYFDSARLILLITYACFHYTESEYTWHGITLISMISLIRGISFFRLFDHTRYIIKLLIEIVKGMKSFAILLAYATTSFSLIFFIYGDCSNASSYFYYLQNSFLLNFGSSGFVFCISDSDSGDDCNHSNYDRMGNYDDKLGSIFYGCATIFNVVILMNMLIAIMSETFNRVRESTEIADYIEIADMVLEVESVIEHDKKHPATYLQLCEAETTLGKEDELTQEIKAIKSIAKKICEKNHISLCNNSKNSLVKIQ